MWENVTPTQKEQSRTGYAEPAKQPETAKKEASAKPEKTSDNLLLWAQIILCTLAFAGALGLRAFQPQGFARLRTAYAQGMQPGTGVFLGEGRNFVKFAQGSLLSLRQAAREVFAELKSTGGSPTPALAATGESAQRAAPHGHAAEAPAGSSTESYQPDFMLTAPLRGTLARTSGYGWRANPLHESEDDFHTGVDLSGAQGSVVLAAADGVVRQAQRGKSYGNFLRIVHGGGDETLYAHMQYLFVRVGQRVRRGEVIGTVGRTGDATGPHLHFELLHEGLRYDPQKALGLGE